ncbi:MAG: sigma-70 family RNA polymerase sigma factor [Fimbriimonadaceae bacterium]
MSEALAKQNGDAEALVLEYMANPRPDLKDLIIVHYSGMVERIARKFRGVESVDDLVQVGYIGLLNALGKFDPEAGVRFNTYATHLVAGEIKHYLRDRSQTIRHPAWLQELRHKVNKTANLLQTELSRTPTEREIADSLGVSEASVREVYSTQDMLRVASLDATPNDDDDSESDVDRLDANLVGPDQVSVEDRVLLEGAMQQLRDLEREVLVMFHFDALNQTEIASQLGISCNYVSHILRQSLTKLRRILQEEESQERVLRRSVPDDKSVMDDETGIYNEDYFRSRLSEEVHRACSTEDVCAVVLVEVNGLGALADFYGQTSVQDFMVDVAGFLKGCVRGLDIVARNGSTGFGIILPGTGSNVNQVVERIQSRANKWLVGRVANGGSVRLEYGFASAPDDGRTAADLLKSALKRSQLCEEGQQAA